MNKKLNILNDFHQDALSLSKPFTSDTRLKIKTKLLQSRPNLMQKYGVEKYSFEDDLNTFDSLEPELLSSLKKTEDMSDVVKNSHHNPFAIDSENIKLDLLTDSGTSLLTKNQKQILSLWEQNIPSMFTYSYAKPLPRKLLDKTISSFFGEDQEFFLTTQGRGSEFLLLGSLHKNDFLNVGDVILSNRPFDTTKGHIEAMKNKVIACTPLVDPEMFVNSQNVFLGNISIEKLIEKNKENSNVKVILVTVTDNGGGGQPVSMRNYKEIVSFAKNNNKLVWLDACRILENALFIHLFEEEYFNVSIVDIAKEMFSMADVSTISFKKIYAHSGGGILLNKNSKLLSKKIDNISLAIKEITTVVYGNGFNSYSGRTGLDMVEIVSGLYEAINPLVIAKRILQPSILGAKLRSEFKLPVVSGGHALYFAADKILPNVSLIDCPAEYLNAIILSSLYVRGCGLGNIVYGKRIGQGLSAKITAPVTMDSLRFAIPREMYSTKYMYVLLSVLGKAFKKGLFENLTGGLDPDDYADDGFYHFKGQYSLKNSDEFHDIVKKVNKMLHEKVENI